MARRCSPNSGGLTLIECLIATVILAITVLAMVPVLSAGRSQLDYADTSLRGVRIGEHFLEEIAARDYHTVGSTRADWGIDGYDGFSDGPGDVTDFLGTLYEQPDQVFQRTVSVTGSAIAVPHLEGITVNGKTVTVTVVGPKGDQWVLSRFIREPFTP